MAENGWNVPNPKRDRVTLHDVAQQSGVSKSTVSLVLQESQQVSTKTRERVLRAIDQIGYVYNRKAAALRQSQQNDQIGVLLNALNTPYSGELLHHFEQLALRRSLLPMFASSGEQLSQQEKMVQLYMEHEVSGFILCPVPNTRAAGLEKIRRNGFPLVQIMREVPFSAFPAVVADNRHGMYQATRHLLGLGHQRIAFIGGSEAISDYHERLAGFLDAMQESGLHVPDGYIYPIPQGRAAGREALQAILDYDRRVTAMVCFSDLMAYGVLSKSRELGIEVGRDLAVIGFDDIADSRLTHPALTTVRVDTRVMAQAALDLLHVYKVDQQAPVERRVIPAELIIRESCGTPQFVNSGGKP